MKKLIILLPLLLSACSTVEQCKRGVLPPQSQYKQIEEKIAQDTIEEFCGKTFEGENVIYYVRDKDGKCVIGGMR